MRSIFLLKVCFEISELLGSFSSFRPIKTAIATADLKVSFSCNQYSATLTDRDEWFLLQFCFQKRSQELVKKLNYRLVVILKMLRACNELMLPGITTSWH